MVKKKTVLVTGNFNVLHPGHIRIFRYAKEVGHKLFVGVNGDSLASNETYFWRVRVCIHNSSPHFYVWRRRNSEKKCGVFQTRLIGFKKGREENKNQK